MIDLPRYYIALSVLPIVVLFLVALVIGWLNRERAGNERRKERYLTEIGYELKEKQGKQEEEEKMSGGTNGTNGKSTTITGTGTLRQRNPDSKPQPSLSNKVPKSKSPSASSTPTSTSTRPLIIGFWHPYWQVPLTPLFHPHPLMLLGSHLSHPELTCLHPVPHFVPGSVIIATPEAAEKESSGQPSTGLFANNKNERARPELRGERWSVWFILGIIRGLGRMRSWSVFR
jgi:hypothetical protein